MLCDSAVLTRGGGGYFFGEPQWCGNWDQETDGKGRRSGRANHLQTAEHRVQSNLMKAGEFVCCPDQQDGAGVHTQGDPLL